MLTAPFPWFGGKRRVAHLVWDRFGDVQNYVEPFAGSLAVLLARPTEPRIETVNDRDCFIANFWRALRDDPDGVTSWCDWPVNEADLHARHRWIHDAARAGFMDQMQADPDFYDVKIAGWWVWGISCWIGDNWCRVKPQEAHPCILRDRGVIALRGDGSGLDNRRPSMKFNGIHRQRPDMDSKGMHRQMPDLQGDCGAAGRGVHRTGLWKTRPSLWAGGDRGVHSSRLHAHLQALSDRLRRVRVCCGDWKRVCGPTPTVHCGLTGVLLDPPYGDESRDKVYNVDSLSVASEVRAWCIERGHERKLRIALCGFEGEHDELEDLGWSVIAWTGSGYGNRTANANLKKERIWFSPHCLRVEHDAQLVMFVESEA